MYSLGSWLGGRYIFSIHFFAFFPVEPPVYPRAWPFSVNIYLSSLRIKKGSLRKVSLFGIYE